MTLCHLSFPVKQVSLNFQDVQTGHLKQGLFRKKHARDGFRDFIRTLNQAIDLAEREGFEPSEPLRAHLISNQAHSANSGTSPIKSAQHTHCAEIFKHHQERARNKTTIPALLFNQNGRRRTKSGGQTKTLFRARSLPPGLEKMPQ